MGRALQWRSTGDTARAQRAGQAVGTHGREGRRDLVGMAMQQPLMLQCTMQQHSFHRGTWLKDTFSSMQDSCHAPPDAAGQGMPSLNFTGAGAGRRSGGGTAMHAAACMAACIGKHGSSMVAHNPSPLAAQASLLLLLLLLLLPVLADRRPVPAQRRRRDSSMATAHSSKKVSRAHRGCKEGWDNSWDRMSQVLMHLKRRGRRACTW